MRFGLTNRIVDNSDFKAVNFDSRLRSNSKSNDESESTIAISIWFWYKIDLFWSKIDLFWSKIDLFCSKFDLFRLKDRKRPSKCPLFNRKQKIISKTTNYIENDDQNNHYKSNLTNFWYKSNYFWYKSNYFRYKWSGFESSRWFCQWFQIVKVD